jgi:F0F1-type ATP synthase alpha subunit
MKIIKQRQDIIASLSINFHANTISCQQLWLYLHIKVARSGDSPAVNCNLSYSCVGMLIQFAHTLAKTVELS